MPVTYDWWRSVIFICFYHAILIYISLDNLHINRIERNRDEKTRDYIVSVISEIIVPMRNIGESETRTMYESIDL